MDNPGHFHRKKIASVRLAGFNAGKFPRRARGVWRKRHTSDQIIAVRRALLPKRHVFRWDFKQRDGQLALVQAIGVKAVIPDILS